MRSGPYATLVLLALAAPARAAEPVVAYTITDGAGIAESLTGAPGDAEAGRALLAHEPRAGCAGCHGLPGASGDAGAERSASDLAGIGGRMDPAAIRLWIVAPVVIAPETEMPAFYAAGQRDGADDPLYGGPALTASEVEDLVAYLSGLKEAE
jgi:sulfur-oxidizing protein SoxX